MSLHGYKKAILKVSSDYFEKQLKHVFFIYITFFIICFVNSSLEITFCTAPVLCIDTRGMLPRIQEQLNIY
jgi:hypothetical protein